MNKLNLFNLTYKKNIYKNKELIKINFEAMSHHSIKKFVLNFYFYNFFNFYLKNYNPKRIKRLANLIKSCFVYSKHCNLYFIWSNRA